ANHGGDVACIEVLAYIDRPVPVESKGIGDIPLEGEVPVDGPLQRLEFRAVLLIEMRPCEGSTRLLDGLAVVEWVIPRRPLEVSPGWVSFGCGPALPSVVGPVRSRDQGGSVGRSSKPGPHRSPQRRPAERKLGDHQMVNVRTTEGVDMVRAHQLDDR